MEARGLRRQERQERGGGGEVGEGGVYGGELEERNSCGRRLARG